MSMLLHSGSLILNTVIGIALIALGIWGLRGRHVAVDLRNALQEGIPCGAQVLNARSIPSPGTGGFVTELALAYIGADGLQHRAFLSVQTPAYWNVQIGQMLDIAVFPRPLTEVSPLAFDPSRGADGALPEQVIPVRFNNVPLDETGTVMLETDRLRLLSKAQPAGHLALGIVAIALGALRLLSLLRLIITMLRFTL